MTCLRSKIDDDARIHVTLGARFYFHKLVPTTQVSPAKPSSPSYYLSSIYPSISIAVIIAGAASIGIGLFHHEVLRKFLNINAI